MSAARSATMPATDAANDERTGTAVLPRPGSSANRAPIVGDGRLVRPLRTLDASDGRAPDAPGIPETLDARRLGMIERALTTARIAPIPISRRTAGAHRPGCGSARRAIPN